MNDNENTLKSAETDKAVLRGKYLILTSFIRKQERLKNEYTHKSKHPTLPHQKVNK